MFGHVLRHHGHEITEGRMRGKPKRESRRIQMLQRTVKDTDAENRCQKLALHVQLMFEINH